MKRLSHNDEREITSRGTAKANSQGRKTLDRTPRHAKPRSGESDGTWHAVTFALPGLRKNAALSMGLRPWPQGLAPLAIDFRRCAAENRQANRSAFTIRLQGKTTFFH
jgi:hypothetical protein